MALDNSSKRRRYEDTDTSISDTLGGAVGAAAAGAAGAAAAGAAGAAAAVLIAARNSNNSDNSFQAPDQSMLYTEQVSSQISRKRNSSKVREDTTSLSGDDSDDSEHNVEETLSDDPEFNTVFKTLIQKLDINFVVEQEREIETQKFIINMTLFSKLLIEYFKYISKINYTMKKGDNDYWWGSEYLRLILINYMNEESFKKAENNEAYRRDFARCGSKVIYIDNMFSALNGLKYNETKSIYETIMHNIQLIYQSNIKGNEWMYDIGYKAKYFWDDMISFFEERIKKDYEIDTCVTEYQKKLERKRLPPVRVATHSEEVPAPASLPKRSSKASRTPRSSNSLQNHRHYLLHRDILREQEGRKLLEQQINTLTSQIATINGRITTFDKSLSDKVKEHMNEKVPQIIQKNCELVDHMQKRYEEFKKFDHTFKSLENSVKDIRAKRDSARNKFQILDQQIDKLNSKITSESHKLAIKRHEIFNELEGRKNQSIAQLKNKTEETIKEMDRMKASVTKAEKEFVQATIEGKTKINEAKTQFAHRLKSMSQAIETIELC